MDLQVDEQYTARDWLKTYREAARQAISITVDEDGILQPGDLTEYFVVEEETKPDNRKERADSSTAQKWRRSLRGIQKEIEALKHREHEERKRRLQDTLDRIRRKNSK